MLDVCAAPIDAARRGRPAIYAASPAARPPTGWEPELARCAAGLATTIENVPPARAE